MVLWTWFGTVFPGCIVANEDNVGFSVANNQAIRACAGRHVLLNPDTVVREDTFKTCLAHADSHPKLGGMGVPMYDGTGRFLPESKRGLPTPWAALCRMSGVHRLAQTSKTFNAYYAGHVDEHETAPVDILSGAFMWMRKEALDQVGLLDEQFFMYGEDIDLSWRLVEGGWENHYFAGTSIIHYKGESTKKGSLNYVMVFYRAMLLFAAKHFEGSQARAFSWMIRTAIYGRAALAIVRRMLGRWGDLLVVLLLTALAMGGSMAAMQAWGGKSFVWPDAAMQVAALLGVQLAGTWALGGYRDRRDTTSVSRHVLAWLSASMATLVVYSLWPESWRLGRAWRWCFLLGMAWRTPGSPVAPSEDTATPSMYDACWWQGETSKNSWSCCVEMKGSGPVNRWWPCGLAKRCPTMPPKFKACLGWERGAMSRRPSRSINWTRWCSAGGTCQPTPSSRRFPCWGVVEWRAALHGPMWAT